ncbi:homoserine kinase [Bacillus mesophilum]|uniref:Homoserine kinase n=1 Tax=Bacillus mesophilum TaxID=1071718 RepID=A0A7V7RLZ8_9BACI|nr:homoserine kinase [Bacillus mesophilum]KAB2332907.1 homoserine kinase [Bacillus mesophilum]
MMEGEMLTIEVPASTANLGPGFDSIGLALNLYLKLEITHSETWTVVPLTSNLTDFPTDESHFIFQIAMKTAKAYGKVLPTCTLEISSEIPLARGLGSSAAAIVAGIELADALCKLKLSKQDKFGLASAYEGHPDNAGASLYGGLVIGVMMDNYTDAVVLHDLDFEIVAAIPQEELLTKESRKVLPSHLKFHEAVKAGAVGNVLVAALANGQFELAGKMMQSDLYHQPYRKELIPHLAHLEEKAIKYGAFGVALSGAGPSVLCFTRSGYSADLVRKLKKDMPLLDFKSLRVDHGGSTVIMSNGNKKAMS